MMRTLKRVMFAFVSAVALPASAVTTNVWTGASSGGLWSAQANWSETLAPTVATVYDFSRLGDGAEVTNDYVYSSKVSQLQIAGLVFGSGKGTVSLLGTATSETIFPSSAKPQIVVPAGTTFDCRLRHTTGPWADSGTKLTFPSPGTVKFTGSSFVLPIGEVDFACAGSAAVFDRVGEGFRLTRLTLSASRISVTVSGNATFADLKDGVWPNTWKVDRNTIVGDGVSTLTFCSGYGFGNLVSGQYTFVTNFQSVAMNGGGCMVRRGPTLANRYVFNNMDATIGREYVMPADPVDNVTGALQLFPGASVDLDGSARVLAYCDQKLSILSGLGTHGRLDIGGTWNNLTEKRLTPGSLTVGEGVSAATSSVFNARLTGIGGGFVKKGSAYDLTLTGCNTYTGSTQVAQGTLTLKRESAYDATAWWWSFDGEDQTLAKAGPSSRSVKFLPKDTGTVTPVADGVRGTRAIHLNGAQKATVSLAVQTPALASGNAPHTIQMWVRPDRSGCCAASDTLTYVCDYGTHWGGHFTRSRIVLHHASAESDDYLLIFTPHNYNTAAVDAGYGVNVPLKASELFDGRWHHIAYVYGRENKLVEAYFDGVLKGSDTLLQEMNLPSEAKFEVGYYQNENMHYYTGDVDELKFAPRALTAEEIRRAAVFAEAQPALMAPTPIIHWTFSDPADIGKDACGAASLSAVSGQTTPSLCTALYAVDGKALSKDVPLQTTGCPECMPTGRQPFTVSCRYLANGSVANSPILWWGDPTVANHYFRLQTSTSDLRSPAVGYGAADTFAALWNGRASGNPQIHHATAVGPTVDIPSAWTDFAVSWNNVAGVLKMYADGMVVGVMSNVWLDIDRVNALTVGMQTLGSETKTFPAYLDDIQIYDRTLSDEEVRLAVRALHGEDDSRVIAASPVTVASGATLAIKGPGHSLAALSAAEGTLDIAYEADFTPNAGDLEIGTLKGYGLLNLAASVACTARAASAFGGTVRVASGSSFSQTATGGAMAGDVLVESGARLIAPSVGEPAPIRTTGRVFLPAVLTVVVPDAGLSGAEVELVSSPSVALEGSDWSYRTAGGAPLDAMRFKIVRSATGVSVRERRGMILLFK